MQNMRAVTLDGGFGLDRLALVKRPTPTPGPGQILVRVHAASLNYRDLRMVQGQYYPHLSMPLVVASDAVGEVVALGSGVSEPAIGTRVCPLFAPNWQAGDPPENVFKSTLGGPSDGTLTEYLVAEPDNVVQVPSYLSDEQAACLPCAALTAYSALFTLGALRQGQHVLCLGTGGVSLFALEFAKARGATVTITSKSDAKLELAQRLGADHVLNYVANQAFGAVVKARFGRVDQVIEVGGAKTIDQSLVALKPGGTLSLIGVLAGHSGPVNLMPILMRQLRVQGVFVGHKKSFMEMLAFMQAHQIVPVVGPVFELADFAAAFEALATQEHFGKICIKLV